MRWGFGWELGPFEIWDAIGVREVLAATGGSVNLRRWSPSCCAQGATASATVAAAGRTRSPAAATARKSGGVVKTNSGASLIDLGDGVLAVEFHSKMNTVGGDTLEMLHAGVARGGRELRRAGRRQRRPELLGRREPDAAAARSAGRQLGRHRSDGPRVSGRDAGAAHADVPVVVAPAGLTLGGGCEIALHGDRVQAAAETYIGLVEAGVGLIPAGGGTKECSRARSRACRSARGSAAAVQQVFETIGFAKVSTSAPDAQRLGFLRDGRRDHDEPRAPDGRRQGLALERVREGYRPPAPRRRFRSAATRCSRR